MSSISHFKYKAFAITLGIFAMCEILVRILPMEFASGADLFLTNYRRSVVENSNLNYDYIILGDSKSLSLLGHVETKAEPYSMYNLSMPALGPSYYQYFFRKYAKSRKNLPKAVILAADPGNFSELRTAPHHDPGMKFSKNKDESLTDYLKNRLTVRMHYGFQNAPPTRGTRATDDIVWDAFSHRYLQLFSFSELADQFVGAERLFILREALPMNLHLYRYRDAVKRFTLGLTSSDFKRIPMPNDCNSCTALKSWRCHRYRGRIEANRDLAADLDKRGGQINLADRLDPVQTLQYRSLKDNQIKTQVDMFSTEKVDMRGVEGMLKETKAFGVKIILADVPSIEEYAHTNFHKEYFKRLHELVKGYPHAKIIRFPRPYYPKEMFVEQVHYECETAEVLNNDFFRGVMPQVLKFAPVETE